MNNLRAFPRNIAGGERASLEHPFQDLFHPEGESVRLGGAFNLRLAESRAQNTHLNDRRPELYGRLTQREEKR